MTDVHFPDPERKAAHDAEWTPQLCGDPTPHDGHGLCPGRTHPAQPTGETVAQVLAEAFRRPAGPAIASIPTPDELAELVARFGGSGEIDRSAPTEGPHPGQELAQASDDYMQMLDPLRPWRLLTSDGHAWVQCADCDSWLQADDALTLEEAKLIALLHRSRDWPHVQPAAKAPPKAKRRLVPWRKRPTMPPRVVGGRRCPECGINEVNERCANGACARSRIGGN